MPEINHQITGSLFRLYFQAVTEKYSLISVPVVFGHKSAFSDILRYLLSGS
ncbi:hypothetical protein TBC1_12998 [Lentimicrobium saccharophilum]|uniref:Uncharacterized protein n=1 Tax=Lentimicrobium saccharophilum TaxID=1678841 RepID=A0A0S7C796_9BACT|nr:hypothetical protein TBC1_12998 [Lentimicrobium saccharophilum]